MELTQEQITFLEEEEKKLLNRFKEVTYSQYEIVPVEDISRADLKISPENNIFDYLAIGIVCLFKEITGCTDKKVYVWSFSTYSSESSGITAIHNGIYKAMIPNALSDFVGKGTCDYILKKCFDEDQLYHIHLADLFVYTDITSIQMGMLSIDGVSLEFKNFNDTIEAQKLAYSTLKTLMVNRWLGGLQEYMLGY